MDSYVSISWVSAKDSEQVRQAKTLAKSALSKIETRNDDYIENLVNDFTPNYIVYTDGSCNNLSPYGEGGAAYVILDDCGNIVKQNSKGFLSTTNNRMELLAILSAVASVPNGVSLLIYTDSRYCIQVLTNKSNVENVKRPNSNIIRRYFEYAERMKDIRFIWVKGHSGDKYNEMVDSLAQARTEEIRNQYGIPYFDVNNSPKIKR